MRKRLGKEIAKGEVVDVLDGREVSDAKNDFLMSMVKADPGKEADFDRQQALRYKRIPEEAAYLAAKAGYSEAILRLDLARQALLAPVCCGCRKTCSEGSRENRAPSSRDAMEGS